MCASNGTRKVGLDSGWDKGFKGKWVKAECMCGKLNVVF